MMMMVVVVVVVVVVMMMMTTTTTMMIRRHQAVASKYLGTFIWLKMVHFSAIFSQSLTIDK